MKSSWNQQRFQAGRAPDPKRNQRLKFDSQKPLSQRSYEKDKRVKGGCERFFHVLIMPSFPSFVLSDASLLKKRKKIPQTNTLEVCFPVAETPQGYSLCFYVNLPSKNRCFTVTNSTLLQAGGYHHVYEGNHDCTVIHILAMRI